MIIAQVVERQRSRESAGVPDFETIGEETDFNRGVTVVISMGYGIDNRFAHGVWRQFVGCRRGDAGGAGADGTVDFGKNEFTSKGNIKYVFSLFMIIFKI